MIPMIRRLRSLASRGLALTAAVLLSSCSLDLENPNAPTEQEVLSSGDGLVALAVGMQGQYAQAIDDYLVTNSLITDEWGTQSRALISYRSLLTGENFDRGFGVVEAPWANSYRVIKSANTLLNARDVGFSTNFQAGVRSLAKLFKAMAFGMLAMQYEEMPIDVSTPGAPFQPRAVALDTVLALLESARADMQGVSEADLAGFRTRVTGTQLNQRNLIDAMLARYYLMAGLHAEAIAAADRVSLTTLSQLVYPTPTRNPVENLAFQLLYVFPLKSFVDQAQPGDRRPAYWVDVEADPLTGVPDSLLLPLRKYSDRSEPFPLFLPGEMLLIKAEALTRIGGAANYLLAAELINQVRTQTSSAVDEPVAGLPPYPPTALLTEAQLLDAIAYERRYELYMQGLRWEDTRRLGTARTTVPTMLFLPIPQQECDTNPAQPCGPGS